MVPSTRTMYLNVGDNSVSARPTEVALGDGPLRYVITAVSGAVSVAVGEFPPADYQNFVQSWGEIPVIVPEGASVEFTIRGNVDIHHGSAEPTGKSLVSVLVYSL